MNYLSNLLLLESKNDVPDWSGVFSRQAPLFVEIGFGCGEVITQEAARHPENNYIGIEINAERIGKTLKRIKRDLGEQDNVRILRIDATVVFERYFNEKSIDEITCFFPCPWPKTKHWKFRLFSNLHLRLLNNRLKSDGRLRIVTDFFPYYEWILKEAKNSGLKALKNTLEPQFNTKFEKKWVAQGQEEFFEICFSKDDHPHVDVKKGVELKAYRIESFNPDNFKFEPVHEQQHIVNRSINFDQEKQEAIVHMFVSEDSLEQHFLITIRRVDDIWKVFKMDGQNIFQTKGIARALDLVYHAALKTA